MGADGAFSGSGTVDFQEFVGGLSAFSSKGGREEKLRCESIPHPHHPHFQRSNDEMRIM